MTDPKDVTIYAQVSPNTILTDFRPRKSGLIFGTAEAVAKQYGIEIKEQLFCCQFTGPKSRLQMFAEKLHFSMINYSYQPFGPIK